MEAATGAEVTPTAPATASGEFRVIVAGGGVAALEAVLALRAMGPAQIEVEVISPSPKFGLKALSVAQPFDRQVPHELDLAEFCDANGAAFRADSVAEVWGEQQRILTSSGEEMFYDALLLAPGARQQNALPGAQPFRGPTDVAWFSELLDELGGGSVRSVAFAVPAAVAWALPLYELALMTGHRLREHGRVAKLSFVTPESSPLRPFGAAIGDHISGLLAASGIELITRRTPTSFDDGVLHCTDGSRIEAHRVITLPELVAPAIPGVPQGRNGFIGCDPEMRVDGMRSVWVAGDASWLPIKQGGLAAQQAEVAAAGIAAAAGAAVVPEPFVPILRAALLTGSEPRFLRSDVPGAGEAEASASPLWWPPLKVAGPRLAPYLAHQWTGGGDEEPTEMEDLEGGRGRGREHEHREAVLLALTYADLDAHEGRPEDALRWLDVAERLNVTLPSEYVERRAAWQEQAGPTTVSD